MIRTNPIRRKKNTYEVMIAVPDKIHTEINFSFFSPILF